jgi:hypothetical protein
MNQSHLKLKYSLKNKQKYKNTSNSYLQNLNHLIKLQNKHK